MQLAEGCVCAESKFSEVVPTSRPAVKPQAGLGHPQNWMAGKPAHRPLGSPMDRDVRVKAQMGSQGNGGQGAGGGEWEKMLCDLAAKMRAGEGGTHRLHPKQLLGARN